MDRWAGDLKLVLEREIKELDPQIKLRDAAGKQFAAGVVLYDGTAATRFGDNFFAMPLRSLWEHA